MTKCDWFDTDKVHEARTATMEAMHELNGKLAKIFGADGSEGLFGFRFENGLRAMPPQKGWQVHALDGRLKVTVELGPWGAEDAPLTGSEEGVTG